MGLKNKAGLLFDSLSIEETFEKYHLSLEENLALKLPNPPYKFGKESINNQYKKNNQKGKIIFTKIQTDRVFKILKRL